MGKRNERNKTIFENKVTMSGNHIVLKESLLRNVAASFSLRPYRDVLFVLEKENWVTNWEARELSVLLREMHIPVRYIRPIPCGLPRQSLFFSPS